VKKDKSARVLLYSGGALVVLFLLGGKLVLAGAITGLGMFVGIMVLLCYSDKLNSFIMESKLGPVMDLGITFGLPAIISLGLGVKGQTMLIATLTCGLLFTFWLNGKRNPTIQKTFDVFRNFHQGFLEGLEEDGKSLEVGSRRTGCHRGTRGSRERQAGQEEERSRTRVPDRRVIILEEGDDYRIMN